MVREELSEKVTYEQILERTIAEGTENAKPLRLRSSKDSEKASVAGAERSSSEMR